MLVGSEEFLESAGPDVFNEEPEPLLLARCYGRKKRPDVAIFSS